ncbi:hypothetical protein SAMN04488065_1532 [Haloplanus vescus]|uniref:Uncharacterized protein n=1 Tax=Haloplanus vescus TaxID=555874 RepID=A0A1H3XFA5_9EURY|nr:hypothetical protein [Haloplanus vescus]SDZ98029.1 hypothetical protein SAMN04488065_1532 [Haloplanus vescus]
MDIGVLRWPLAGQRREFVSLKISEREQSDIEGLSEPPSTIRQSGGVTEYWHCSPQEGKQAKSDDDRLVDGATFPIFAFGNQIIGRLIAVVSTTGNDIGSECNDGFAAGRTIAPLFKSLFELAL